MMNELIRYAAKQVHTWTGCLAVVRGLLLNLNRSIQQIVKQILNNKGSIQFQVWALIISGETRLLCKKKNI